MKTAHNKTLSENNAQKKGLHNVEASYLRFESAY